MGWFSWLFGGAADHAEDPPEPLVLGAKLKCPYSSGNSYLYVDTQNIELNNLPEACVEDCVPLKNILPFQDCTIGNCEYTMQFTDKWVNMEPQRKLMNGKEIITTKSMLICERAGIEFEILTSGQEGDFANQLQLIRHMDAEYPGLRSILEDPYGSLYLKPGMYEMTLRFLEERVNLRTNIQTMQLYDQSLPENAYILAALERLLPYCNTRNPDKFLAGIEDLLVKSGADMGVDKYNLNAAMLKEIKKDCQVTNGQIQSGGIYRFQEEHKMFTSWLADSVNSAAFAAIMYASMSNRNQKSDKEWEQKQNDFKKEVAKDAAGEGTGKTPEYNQKAYKTMQDNYDYYKGNSGYDCSEIAEDLYNAANGEGKVYRITPKEGAWMKGMEYGSPESWVYHEVYSDGYYIFDPMYSTTPVLKGDYFRILNGELNSSGLLVTETVPYSVR